MADLLSYLDESINTFFQQNNRWPEKIICSEVIKQKILTQYKECLQFYVEQDKTFIYPQGYRGILFELDENETFVKVG
jgi:hypothetical protein